MKRDKEIKELEREIKRRKKGKAAAIKAEGEEERKVKVEKDAELVGVAGSMKGGTATGMGKAKRGEVIDLTEDDD